MIEPIRHEDISLSLGKNIFTNPLTFLLHNKLDIVPFQTLLINTISPHTTLHVAFSNIDYTTEFPILLIDIRFLSKLAYAALLEEFLSFHILIIVKLYLV